MADLIAKGLSDTAMIKLRKKKEADGFGDRDWAAWLAWLARDMRTEDTFREHIQKQTAKFLLQTWMSNFAENLPEMNKPGAKTIADLVPNRQNLDEPEGTAIVIGRGPSVFKRNHLKMLAESDYRGTVINTDGILIEALKAGVTPDKYGNFLVCTVDGNRTRIVRWYGDPDFERNNPNATEKEKEENAKNIELVNEHGKHIKAVLSTSVAHNVYRRCIDAGIKIFWFHPLFDDYRSNESFSRLMTMMTTTEEHKHGVAKVSCGGNSGSTCVPPQAVISCQDGEKPIEKVAIGDKVLTHNGIYGNVIKTFRRNFDGILYKIKPAGGLPFLVTGEHPILVVRPSSRFKKLAKEYSRGRWGKCGWGRHPQTIRKVMRTYFNENDFQWIPALELTKEDFLVFPIPREIADLDTINLEPKYRELLDQRNTVLDLRRKTGWGAKRISKYLKLSLGNVQGWFTRKNLGLPDGANKINEIIKVDEDFLRLIGYYLAEGSFTPPGFLRFCFNKHEVAYIKDVEILMRDKFGLNVNSTSSGNVKALSFFSTSLLPFFRQFGDKARNKKIPYWIMVLSPKKQIGLIAGYLRGDGGKTDFGYYLDSSSKELAMNLRQILLRLGVISTIIHEKRHGKINVCGRLCSVHDKWRIQIQGAWAVKLSELLKEKLRKRRTFLCNWFGINKDYLITPIKGVEKIRYNGPVHNLEVKNGNSYCMLSSYATLHNCWVLSHALLRHSPVCLIGLDLGYPEDTPLSKTHYYSSLMQAMGGNVDAVKGAYREVVNPSGERAYADLVFWHYREAFLEMAKEVNPKFETWNCTGSGTLFDPNDQLVKWKTFKEFLEAHKE